MRRRGGKWKGAEPDLPGIGLRWRVLDCGCGGGANIRTLLKKCPHGIVKGIDYSGVSVEQAGFRNLEMHKNEKG